MWSQQNNLNTSGVANSLTAQVLLERARSVADSVQKQVGSPLQVDYVSQQFDSYKKFVVVVADFHDGGPTWALRNEGLPFIVANTEFIIKLQEILPAKSLFLEGIADNSRALASIRDKTVTEALTHTDMLDVLKSKLGVNFIPTESNSDDLLIRGVAARVLLFAVALKVSPGLDPDGVEYKESIQLAMSYVYKQTSPTFEVDYRGKELYERNLRQLASERDIKVGYLPIRYGSGKSYNLLLPIPKRVTSDNFCEIVFSFDQVHHERERIISKVISSLIDDGAYAQALFGGAHRERFYRELEERGCGVVSVRAFETQAEIAEDMKRLDQLREIFVSEGMSPDAFDLNLKLNLIVADTKSFIKALESYLLSDQ
jgi:hypothetical protein